MDHRRVHKMIQKAVTKFNILRELPMEAEDKPETRAKLRSLMMDVLEIIYLEIHITNRQNGEFSPPLDTLPLAEQGRIYRAILDFSPSAYIRVMLPWVVGHLEDSDQVCIRVTTQGIFLSVY